MSKLTLSVLDKEYSIHRLHPDAKIPTKSLGSTFYSITRTDQELSIVCESAIKLRSIKENRGWSCLKVNGPLDLNQTGIIANITALLAKANISIFCISTFDTDYLLLKSENITRAKDILKQGNYRIL